MKKLILALVACLCCLGSSLSLTEAAPMKSAAFVVLQGSNINAGRITASIYKDWRQQVRQAYHVPYYLLEDKPEYQQITQEVLRQEGVPTSRLAVPIFKEITDRAGLEVLVLLCVNAMEEEPLNNFGLLGWDWESTSWLRVYASADIYVYKASTGKLLVKNFRKVETVEEVNVEHPERKIKYALRRLVNEMEGREQI